VSVTDNFKLLQQRIIPELRLEAFHFSHIPTGAEILSLVNDDENKVFGVTLRTPSTTSNGVAHILEHAVLCGSRKYPVKDPFLELIKGSLYTFLNAFTYPDKTCYPVASQNLQDFYNLIDVYLDAVFFPLLSPEAFQQEGWRYELDDAGASLAIKGVVYNEMKGVYASPDEVLSQFVRASLFPDTSYRFDHGGDPAVIPSLSYEAFLAYHKDFYHPSNARFFFCGDDDPNKRLEILDTFLQGFDRQKMDSAIALQPAFEAPRRFHHTYQADDETSDKEKTVVTVNWLVGRNGEPEHVLSWAILQHILIGTPAAPLRRRLLDSGLGEDLAGDGFGSQLQQLTFSIGLRGVKRENTTEVEKLVEQTLADIAQHGIDADTIQSAINVAEFQMREQNPGGLPRGLVMMLDSLLTWLHDQDPLLLLPFEKALSHIKRNASAGDYFEAIIFQDLLLNPHRTTVVLEPDNNLNDTVLAAERDNLAQTWAAMTGEDRLQLSQQTESLHRWYETPDNENDLTRIPALSLSDIDPQQKRTPLEIVHVDPLQILINDLPTNGICYIDIGLDLHALPQEYLPYLSLFSRGIMELGTEEELDQLWHRISCHTGGVWSSLFNSAKIDATDGASWLFLRTKAHTDKVNAVTSILEDLLLHTRLDNSEKVRQMVIEEHASLESGLSASGTHLAELRLLAPHNEGYWVDELTAGVSYLQFIRGLHRNLDERLDEIIRIFADIRRRLSNTHTVVGHITVEGKDKARCLGPLVRMLEQLPSEDVPEEEWSPPERGLSEGFIVDSQVSFVSKAASLYALGMPPHGSAAVICSYLQNSWLWEQVRARGGAYDCSCGLRDGSGVMHMSSFRDPSPLTTVESFDGSGEFLRSRQLTKETLSRTIIGAIGDLDSYQLPDAKGYSSFLWHLVRRSDDLRQQRREEILTTQNDHFRRMSAYFDEVAQAGNIVIVGSRTAVETANRAWNGQLQIQKLQ
jgi:presequence protease